MKKLLLAMLIGIMSINASAQMFLELNIGFPTGEKSDNLGLEYNIKTGYLFKVTSDLSIGGIIGLSAVKVKDEDLEGMGFYGDSFLKFTLGFATRYNISESVVLGVDLGHGGARAKVLNDNLDIGNFYFRPLIGYKVGRKVTINASYDYINVGEDGLNSLNSFLIGLSFIR